MNIEVQIQKDCLTELQQRFFQDFGGVLLKGSITEGVGSLIWDP